MRIREFRKNNKLTQEQLAQKAGLTREFISYLETGKKTCSMKTLKKIAFALNTEMRELI